MEPEIVPISWNLRRRIFFLKVCDVRREVDAAVSRLKSSKTRASAAKELRELRRELRDRERKVTAEVIKGADVVLATLTSADASRGPLACLEERRDSSRHFDVVVVDECSQVSEWVSG